MQEIKPKWNKFSVFNVDSLAKIQEKLKNKHLDVARTSEQGGLMRGWWEKKDNVALTVLSIIQKVLTFDYNLTHKT